MPKQSDVIAKPPSRLADAQVNLGIMYDESTGVPESGIEALKWYSLAKAQGNENAAHNLDIIKEEMPPSQTAKAQELAAEWWEKQTTGPQL